MLKTLLLAGTAALALTAGAASAQTLRFGLQDDPDALDPTLARTFVGRIVFDALCNKLVDIAPDLTIVPQLATEWSWSADNKSLTMKLRPNVTFHDGEPMDAEAVKFNLNRHLTMQGSQRRGEISAIASMDVVDPLTIRINLKAPSAPFLSQLTDRAGMMVSPKAATALGDKFATAPVCSGPFRFVERVAQDRIVLEKFPAYWNAANIHFQRLEFRPFPDNSVKLANLRAGQLDFIERVAATDVGDVKKDPKLKLGSVTELGYNSLVINVANGDRSKSIISTNPKVREAFELALDREALVQVVFNGEFQAGNQWSSPENANYSKNVPMPKRDVAKAKQLLTEAGVTLPVVVSLVAPNNSDSQQIAQVVQAMAREAGFDVKIQSAEFATSLNMADKGEFEMYIRGWSGRTDPDGNLYSFIASDGPQNYSRYSSARVDELLKLAREKTDLTERRKAWDEIAEITLQKDRPVIYLYHRKWLYAYSTKLTGFKEYPDGLVRFAGMKFN